MRALGKHCGFPGFALGKSRQRTPDQWSKHMLGRRSFLIGCGGMVAAPACAHLAPPLTGRHPPQSAAADSLASTALADVASPEDLVLRVDGWDTPEDSDPAAHSEVWIHINSSWQAAWR